jgi:hypothetical protein
MTDLNRAAIGFARGDREHARELLGGVEARLSGAGIVLDPDDAYEVGWLRAALHERRIGAINREGAPMYARLISFTDAGADKRDAGLEMIRGTVIPTLQGYDGFAGYVALWDADSSRAKAIILWDSKDAAETAEETLAERRKGMTQQVGISIESTELYEAPVVELAGARA